MRQYVADIGNLPEAQSRERSGISRHVWTYVRPPSVSTTDPCSRRPRSTLFAVQGSDVHDTSRSEQYSCHAIAPKTPRSFPKRSRSTRWSEMVVQLIRTNGLFASTLLWRMTRSRNLFPFQFPPSKISRLRMLRQVANVYDEPDQSLVTGFIPWLCPLPDGAARDALRLG